MMSFISMSFEQEESAYEKARSKANDSNMTVNGNPLRTMPSADAALIRKNMRRLEDDADAWSDRRTGEVYRAIRGMTLNKGE